MQTIKIQKPTYKRLVSHIDNFGESEDNVINKALDALELQKKKVSQIQATPKFTGTQLQFNPSQIPNTYHSKLVSMKIDGVVSHVQKWIELLDTFIKIAIDRGLSNFELKQRYAIKLIQSPENQKPYRFASTIGAWIQPLSSSDILEKVQNIAKDLHIHVEIEIRWYQNDKAQFPGCEARIQIN